MNLSRLAFLSFALSSGPFIQAQITLAGSSAQGYSTVWSLTSNGPKFMRLISPGSGVELVNLDFTPFLTINYPAPPSGYVYLGPGDGGEGIGRAWYITEALFDTDSNTIEVLALLGEQGSAGQPKGVRVIRQDGTIVFEDLEYSMAVYISADFGGLSSMDRRPAIFQDQDGTAFMLLRNFQNNASRVYQLPGSVPCSVCNGISVGMVEGGNAPDGIQLEISPNPTANELNVRYSGPFRAQSLRLVITDANGRLVKEQSLDGSGTSTLILSNLSAGSYQCTLRDNTAALRTKSFHVVR